MIKILGISTGILFLTAAVFFGLWRFEVVDHRKTSGVLEATETALIAARGALKKHEEDIKLVERTNHEYETDNARLRADVKRLRATPARCVPVRIPSSPSGIHSEPRSGRGHGDQNGDGGSGVNSSWLYDYAIEAEQLRIDRNACKKFVNDVWESRGQ